MIRILISSFVGILTGVALSSYFMVGSWAWESILLSQTTISTLLAGIFAGLFSLVFSSKGFRFFAALFCTLLCFQVVNLYSSHDMNLWPYALAIGITLGGLHALWGGPGYVMERDS